jgi:hypothetical protein
MANMGLRAQPCVSRSASRRVFDDLCRGLRLRKRLVGTMTRSHLTLLKTTHTQTAYIVHSCRGVYVWGGKRQATLPDEETGPMSASAHHKVKPSWRCWTAKVAASSRTPIWCAGSGQGKHHNSSSSSSSNRQGARMIWHCAGGIQVASITGIPQSADV